MRKIILLLIVVAMSVVKIQAQNSFDDAQKAYQEKDYARAISLYEDEIKTLQKEGKVSADLFYNLGNAYFRANDIPEAILNYERAQLYNPGDRDIKHNIEYANTKIEDKILNADTFFLGIWFTAVQNLMSSTGWAKLAIVFFLFLIGSLTLFFFTKSLVYKKIGFYLGVVCFILSVFSNIFAFRQQDKISHRDTAIVMVGIAPVVSSPTSNSNEVFVLHAGTKVEITKVDGDWMEIEIADGSVGWIQRSKLEII